MRRSVAWVTLSVIALMVARIVVANAPATRPTSQPASQPAAAAAATLTVEIKDLRNARGDLIFGVFNQADGFPTQSDKSVFWEVRATWTNDKSIVFTVQLPPGRYGASVLHDENRSGNMERGWGGIPKEGYGVTNNPKPRFRAATFQEATFELPAEGAKKTISLQYF